MATTWEGPLFSGTRAWLAETLRADDIDRIVPPGDPIRVWLGEAPAGDATRLLEVVSGADDALTWLALMDAARVRQSPPPPVEQAFSQALASLAGSSRVTSYPSQFHAFLSYSHRDMERAAAVVELLAAEGIRVFQDVRDIHAGESILGRIHGAMTQAPRAILLVTQSYAKSIWADRELSLLLERQQRNELILLPLLLDDVPLPERIAGIFTIDLRGFSGASDREWAKKRLAKVVDACK